MIIDRITSMDGSWITNGFFVRNKAGKALAIGVVGPNGWVMPSRKRYARDVSFCAALLKLTGLPVKWNLTYKPGKPSDGGKWWDGRWSSR